MAPHFQRPLRLFAAECDFIPPHDEDDSLWSYSIPWAVELPRPCRFHWHRGMCFYGPASDPPIIQSE